VLPGADPEVMRLTRYRDRRVCGGSIRIESVATRAAERITANDEERQRPALLIIDQPDGMVLLTASAAEMEGIEAHAIRTARCELLGVEDHKPITWCLDRQVIKNCEGLEFLVLDELHTYRGRQGADVAMLVRRLRERLTPSGQLQCIGTSATMASEGSTEGRNRVVAEVASRPASAAKSTPSPGA
jgi:hypothetical protein